MNPPDFSTLPDLQGRDDIKILVDSFYEKVREDSLIGFIFDEVAEVDWARHLPKMYDFWETMIFQSGRYQGNPLRPHLDLSSKTDMGPEKFERWESLFSQTVNEHFAGEKADHIKNIATDMAQVMQSKISGTPRTMTFAPDSPRPEEKQESKDQPIL